jgi:hypothetical protein
MKSTKVMSLLIWVKVEGSKTIVKVVGQSQW